MNLPMLSCNSPSAAASRWACAYFFATCGLAYGSVMSRIPAIKVQAGLDEAQLGSALLWLGLGALTAFPLAGWVISRVGSRLVQWLGGLALLVLFPLTGMVTDQWSLSFALYGMGLATGTTEVAMSTQAVLIEKALRRPCMSSLHAMFSLGGLLGAVGGSVFSGCGVNPLLHFCLTAAFTLLILPFAAAHLLRDTPEPRSGKASDPFRLPGPGIFVYGLLALCAYASEGSVGDWGALLLHQVKGASEQMAALAYAAFSVTMVVARLGGDRVRAAFGDARLMLYLALLATGGMLTSQFSPWPLLCLLGYAGMGMGLSVIVPIIFSAVGKRKDVSVSTGATIVSSLAYGGQLLVPPLIGILGHSVGLHKAMFVVVFLCLCLVLGSRLFNNDDM